MTTTHLLRAPNAPPVPVAWPSPTIIPPAPTPSPPAPEAVWAPPPPPPVEAPPEPTRSRRGLILPIVAALVLVLGLGVAVGGLLARGAAESSATRATDQLALVTQQRDEMSTLAATAATDLVTARATLAASTVEAARVAELSPFLAAAGDELLAALQAQVDAERAFDTALAAGDEAGVTRALAAWNDGVDNANAALVVYEALVYEVRNGTSDGGITITFT